MDWGIGIHGRNARDGVPYPFGSRSGFGVDGHDSRHFGGERGIGLACIRERRADPLYAAGVGMAGERDHPAFGTADAETGGEKTDAKRLARDRDASLGRTVRANGLRTFGNRTTGNRGGLGRLADDDRFGVFAGSREFDSRPKANGTIGTIGDRLRGSRPARCGRLVSESAEEISVEAEHLAGSVLRCCDKHFAAAIELGFQNRGDQAWEGNRGEIQTGKQTCERRGGRTDQVLEADDDGFGSAGELIIGCTVIARPSVDQATQ